MDNTLYKVYRYCDGMIEDRFKGTREECVDWIKKRGDIGRVTYWVEECPSEE